MSVYVCVCNLMYNVFASESMGTGGTVLGLSWWKERLCLGSREENVRAKLVIFKVSTDGCRDELAFFGTTLNRGGILCWIVLQHGPERFSQCSLFFTQKWTWQGNFPSTLHLHPVSPAQRGLKAVLTQQWFEWSVYTVGLCPLVTIQSPLMAYWLSALIVAGIKVLSLFMTAGLQNLNVSQFCASSRHILASVTHGFSVTPQKKTESSPSNPTRKNCASPRVTLARQHLQRPRSVWWVAIRCFCRKLLPWRWKPGPV